MKSARLGLIGDVHGAAKRLEAALTFMRAANLEHILGVGDIVDGDGDVDLCCELLEGAKVAVVRGNHDRWLLANQMRDLPGATRWEELSDKSKSFIQSLPRTRSFETIAGQLLLCHGLGGNDMQRLTPDDYGYALEVNEPLHQLTRERHYRFVVGGHTHRRMVRRFEHLTIINAGTLYDSHNPCFAIADFAANAVQFYEFVDGHGIAVSGQPIKL